MKQCSSCGLNSSDGDLYCQTCGTALPTTEPESSAPPILESQPGTTAASPITDRKWRVIDICLVCFIAFGGSLLASTYHLFTGLPQTGYRDSIRWWSGICHEIGVLALLWYVLKRRSEGFSHIGFRCNGIDLALTPLLWAMCCAAYYTAHFFISTFLGPYLEPKRDANVASYLFSSGVTFATILFAMLNPFYEELIVRAYLMTQLRQIGNNWTVPIAISVLLQVSYHFYQGSLAALSHMGVFLILSIYYAITKRIGAPILVHLIFDLWPTIYYMVRPIH